mgnify:CR=1 FL=1
MTATSFLYDLAQEILDTAEDSLSQARTGHPAPNRVNVAWGEPPADECCGEGGQLTIHLDDDIAVTHATRGNQPCMILPTASFVITLFRCHAGSSDNEPIPGSEVLDADAKSLMADLWALLTGIYDAIADASLFADIDCATVTVGPAATLTPEGGCAGLTVRLSVALSDTGPT